MAEKLTSALKVMMIADGAGGMTPLLCDPAGVPLPGQTRVDIRTGVDDLARVTVEFIMFEFA